MTDYEFKEDSSDLSTKGKEDSPEGSEDEPKTQLLGHNFGDDTQ